MFWEEQFSYRKFFFFDFQNICVNQLFFKNLFSNFILGVEIQEIEVVGNKFFVLKQMFDFSIIVGLFVVYKRLMF